MHSNQLRLRVLFVLLLRLSVPCHFAAGQGRLLTVAEATGFRQTSLHSDVLDFVSELQALSPLVRVETMAVSAEGRPLARHRHRGSGAGFTPGSPY